MHVSYRRDSPSPVPPLLNKLLRDQIIVLSESKTDHCHNSTAHCPDTFCPVPVIRCDCCKLCAEDCRKVVCPETTCLKPIIPPGECCGTCETNCTQVNCVPLKCPSSDQIYKPGACCPSCKSDIDGDDGANNETTAFCLDAFCPNPINCHGCLTCRQDCRAVSCARPSCPNPIVPPGECCGHCEKDCSTVRCAKPLCRHPKYEPGACCPTCDNSTCKFEGCVTEGENPSWQPNQCVTCRCSNDNQSLSCTPTHCTRLDCGRNPSRVVPGNCCPTCDYGVPDDECGVAPFKPKNITVRSRFGRLRRTVMLHQCDKPFIRKDGTLFSCVPKNDIIRSSISLGDREIARFKYTDVVSCSAKPWSKTCDLFIP